jgi:hypothetical protein
VNGGKYGYKTKKKKSPARKAKLFSGRACVSASQLEREMFFLDAMPEPSAKRS